MRGRWAPPAHPRAHQHQQAADKRRAGGPNRPPHAQVGLRIITHNVRGATRSANSKNTCQLVRQWVQELQADIVCLQETHLSPDDEAMANQHLLQAGQQYTAFWAPKPRDGSDSHAGVGILVRSHLLASGDVTLQSRKTELLTGAAAGRGMALHLKWRGHCISLWNVYLPSGQPQQQQDFISAHLDPALSAAPTMSHNMVVGDWNFTEQPTLDRWPQRHRKQGRDGGVARVWGQLAEARGLQDAYRARHPQRREYSFYHAGSRSRIDRIYVTQHLMGYVESCNVQGYSKPSDHRPVLLRLRPAAPSTTGRGIRRLRVAAFKTIQARKALQKVVQELVQRAPTDPYALLIWYPTFKKQMTAAARRIAREIQQQKVAPSAAKLAAQQELTAAEAQLDAVAPGQHVPAATMQRVTQANRALAAAVREEALPDYRAARQEWLHEGERPSPLMSALMTRPDKSGQIPSLRTVGGGLLEHGPELAAHTCAFYAQVSTKPQTDAAAQQQVVDAVASHHTKLPQDLAATAGAAQVSVAEVRKAIKNSKPGTSPGPDGIPGEVWRWCKDQLAPLLSQLFTAMGQTGQAPAGFNRGAVTAIYKGKGDRADLSNYRPITLLNSDYRLLAKILATRWGPTLGAAIGREQTAFLPGRLIGENVMFMQLLPAALRAQRGTPDQPNRGAVGFLDFKKAYDTVDRDFLFAVMRAAGASDGMCAWAQLLLQDTKAVAVVNGHVSQPHDWEAGVRQGCPLAPAMYLFVAWALSIWLQTRPQTDKLGLMLAGRRIACVQYADDTAPLLSGWSTSHVQALLDAMDTFGNASGQRLNLGKCALLLLGRHNFEPLPTHVCGMAVVEETQSLGIIYSDEGWDVKKPAGVDWDARIKAVSNSYAKLARLPMSVFGRALGAAGYGISKLLYHAEFSQPPDSVLQQLSKITAKLVDRKLAPDAIPARKGLNMPGIKTSLLMGPPGAGGVGVLPWKEHITARHAVWAARMLEGLGRLPYSAQPPADCPPWVIAAATILKGMCASAHPALTFLTACLTDQAATLPCTALQRLGTGLIAMQPPTMCSLLDLGVGEWCMHMPIWNNPLLQLERALEQRPAQYRQLLIQQLQDRAAAANAEINPAKKRQLLQDWNNLQGHINTMHDQGCARLKVLPETATVDKVVHMHDRMRRMLSDIDPARRWWQCSDGDKAFRAAAGLGSKHPRCREARLLINDPAGLQLQVEALVHCLPRSWVQRARTRVQGERIMGTLKAECHAVQMVLRGVGWPAAEVAALPRALRTQQGCQARLECAAHSPMDWVPATFHQQPHMQLFSTPLPLSVRLATRLQQSQWRADVCNEHRRTVVAALQLEAIAAGGQQWDEQTEDQLCAALGPRLSMVWKLKLDNKWKEGWWRLLLNGVRHAGGHEIGLKGPCPCGWAPDAGLDGPAIAAAQRKHVHWDCAPAQAVRQVLAHNLPQGVQLHPRHLWLLEPPCPDVHPGVWAVVATGALTAIQWARGYMWRRHMDVGGDAQRGRAAQQQTLRSPHPAGAAAYIATSPGDVTENEEDEDVGFGSQQASIGWGRRRRQGQGAHMLQPSTAAARRAVARLADAVWDFVDVGRLPVDWVNKVGPGHCFIGVHTTTIANTNNKICKLVCTLNMPELDE